MSTTTRTTCLLAGLTCAAVISGCGSDEKSDTSATTVKTAPAAHAASVGVQAPGLIAFRRYSDPSQSEGAVFTIKPDGTGERQITHPPSDYVDDQPTFNADGSKIAFERCPGVASTDPCRAYVINRDGSGEHRVTVHCSTDPVCDSSAPAWSDDGRLAINLAEGREKKGSWGNQIQISEIAVVDLKRHTQRLAARLDHWQGDLGNPYWSPDGKRIVYQRQWSPISNKVGLALFVVPAGGGKAKRVTAEDMAAGDHPSWSADGKWIAFRTGADKDPGEGPSTLSLIHPDGTGYRALKAAGDSVGSTGFSPDGAWITYGAPGAGGEYDVWVMHPDGSDKHPVTRTKAWDSAPDWGP